MTGADPRDSVWVAGFVGTPNSKFGGNKMQAVINILKPTVPKCVGAIFLAAAQYYGAAVVFMLSVTFKVLAEPESWKKMVEEFQKCGIDPEDLS